LLNNYARSSETGGAFDLSWRDLLIQGKGDAMGALFLLHGRGSRGRERE